MSITVFLADDHTLVREGFRLLLERQQDIKVIGEASNGREAVRQVTKLQPDIIVLDIAMPELNGIEAARQICESLPSAKIIILSMHTTTQHVFRALKAGACGYVLKESAGDDLIKAVRTVHKGLTFLCSEISDLVVKDYIRFHETEEAANPLSRLNPREREILQLIAEGKSNSRIAELLYLSNKTIETYRSHLMQKLGINDIASLVKFAIQHGITTVE